MAEPFDLTQEAADLRSRVKQLEAAAALFPAACSVANGKSYCQRLEAELARVTVSASGSAWANLTARAEQAEARVAELEATKCQEDHLHPDWSMLEASRSSLREAWVREKRLHAVLEREAMAIGKDRTVCRLCRTEGFDRNAPHPHHPSCALVHQPEEPEPTPERLVLVEIANHLSMRLAWGVDPGTVDVEWIKDAIDARSERTHAACIIAAGKKDSEAALAVECDVDPLAP